MIVLLDYVAIIKVDFILEDEFHRGIHFSWIEVIEQERKRKKLMKGMNLNVTVNVMTTKTRDPH